MAQGEGNIIIDVGGNTRQLEKDIAKVANQSINLNIKGFGQPLGKISGQLGEFEKSLAASNARVLAFGASAGAIYAVEKALGDTLRSAIKVQKALQDINVILNANTSSLKNFGAELFNIAKDTGQSFDVVAKAATELSRQGLGIEQTLKRTSDALILTRLSGLDTVSSVEALTAAINSFNNSALDSTQIVNKLAAVDAGFAVSSADLAEAIKRVGSSAEDAGVSFDQLIAIVTSAQQITSRGGSVIGNSLKTIFTRLQRPKVLDDLEAIGVVTRDQEGNIRPLIQILSDLSKSYESLSGVQKSSIAETVGGVFQINILKAALGDLNSEYSIYSRALAASTGATDEAIQRNEQLNQTLDALINKTVQNLTKVSAGVGEDVFGPAIKKILGGLNTALESFDESQSQDVGSKIGKGLLKGLGDFLSGPGLAIGGLALFKIFERLTVYAADAFKSITGLNTLAAEQKILQTQILSILSKNPDIIKQINAGETSLVNVHKTLLSLIEKETIALNQQASIASTLSQSLYGAGVRVGKTGATKGLPTKHGGFIPNYSLSEELAGVQGSSDYSRSEKNKARPFLTNLNGQMVYANDQEIKVSAKNIYKKMGLPDGTKPKNPSEKYGILNPKQQKMLGFSSGFIPNFKNPNQLKPQDVANQIDQFASVKNIPSNQYDPSQSKARLDALKNSLQGLRVLKAAISKSPDFSGKSNLTSKLDTTYNDLKKRYDDQKQSYVKTLYSSEGSIYSAVLGEQDANQQYSRGFIPNFQGPAQVDLNKLDPTISSKYGVLVGKGQSGSVDYTQGVADIPSLKNVLPRGSGVSVKLRQRSAFPLTSGGINESEKEFDKLLQSAIGPGLQSFAQNISQNILGKNQPVQSFVNQLGSDVKGSLFEKSVRAALIDPNQIDRIPSDNAQAAFDFDPASSFLGFQELFGLKNVKAIEAKVSDEAAKSGRLPNKVLTKEPSLLGKIIQKYGAKGIQKFTGFVPNFKDDLNQARQEALAREKSASGLPDSQIKLVKDNRLKNQFNPYGEAVINKRDEPSGTAMEGIKRFKSLKDARRAGMPDMRWMGYVPNFAKYGARDPKTGRFVKQTEKTAEQVLDTAPAQSALSKFQEKALLASFAFSTLGGVIEQFTGEEDKKTKNFINAVSSGASAFATLAGVIPGQAGLIVGAVAGIGIAADGLIKTLNEKSPGIASSLEKVKEENQKFSDATDRYLQTYNQLNETISNTEGDQEKVSQQIVKLNQELAKIAFDLPEAYRKEILTTNNIADLQEKIGQVKAQQLEKEKALTTALDIQSKIDASQGIGRMLLGMGQNVLNKPGEARKAGGGVIKDIGMDNLIKLAEDTKLVNESQQNLIKTLEKTYGMSQEVGDALSQLSSSDFESLRAVLISTANDTKNIKDMNEELNKVRKEEAEKIRNLNKAISESKAKLSDLTKQLFNDISAQRQLGATRKENSRDVSLKELENRAALNKPFQSENTQALSSYYLDLVKNEKEYAEKSQQIIEEGNQQIIKQFQEILAKGGQDNASIDLTAQQEVLQKIAAALKDPNFNVTPDWLGAEFEKVLKGQQVDQEELQKLSKLTEDQKRELGQKIAQQTEVLKKANDLAALQLAFAKQAAKNAIDLKSAGGIEGFSNPEARKAEVEKELNAYNTLFKMNDKGASQQLRNMPVQYGRATYEIAKQDQANFGVGPTSLETDTINQANAKRIQAEIDATKELKKENKARAERELEKTKTEKGSTLYNAEQNKNISSDATTRIYAIDQEIAKADKDRGKLAEERYNKEEEITKSTNDFSKAINAEERKIAQEKITEQTKNLNEIEKQDKDLQQKAKDAKEKREKIYKEEVPSNIAKSLREMDTRIETRRATALSEGAKIKEYDKLNAQKISEKQTAEAFKTAPLDNENYFKGVADLREAIKGDTDKNKPLTEEAFRAASKEASDANVQAIKDLLNEMRGAEASKQTAQDEAKKATEDAIKRKEIEQYQGKLNATSAGLQASSKSLFGAKAQQYSFYESDEERAARMQSSSRQIPQVIQNAAMGNASISSTSDLITQLKTNKDFGGQITAGTNINPQDLLTELESAYAKKGTEQREEAFVSKIDELIKIVQQKPAPLASPSPGDPNFIGPNQPISREGDANFIGPIRQNRTDISGNVRDNQIQNATRSTETKREETKQKQDQVKIQTEANAKLEDLSLSIKANTETQTKRNDKEDQKDGEGEVKAKGEINAPSKIEFGTIKIDVSVNGSIDQLPDATSQKTIAAIKDAVNQILPGEISKRLGALKS